ncbi:hypothetical protein AWZ03_002206 [Drosophila navojoa]|uniref:BPTI/Kunitz inhibitor domain-containing protein n=1 Tax=Drosophila navojoa TaxID=7232 RepID=A0A484BUI0_DRONA|nr:carboxypeptidase inhibitor SmCI-like [Drosophila navojoa]TDG51411.1 hypothetical protein AWZ03_002206 [Drosophila navojoa]
MQLLPLVGSLIVLAQGHNWPNEPLFTSIRCWAIVDPGHCRGSYRMFGYDPYSGYCIPFIYTGCGGNPNRFQSEIECINKCKMSSGEMEYDSSSSSMSQGSGDDVPEQLNVGESNETGSGNNSDSDSNEPIITVDYYDTVVAPQPIEDYGDDNYVRSDNKLLTD